MSIVSGASSASVRIVASFPRRGIRRIEPPTLVVSDALELARVVRESPSPAQELLVLPRTERVKWVPGRGREVAPRHRSGGARAVRCHRGRRPAALPSGHAGVPNPLAGARARGRIARATAARGHRDAPARRRRRPDGRSRPRARASRRGGQGRRLARARARNPHRLRPAASGRVPPARDRAGPDRVAHRPRQARAGGGRARDQGPGARARCPLRPGPVRRGDAAGAPARRVGGRRRPGRDSGGPEGAGHAAAPRGQLRGGRLPRVRGRRRPPREGTSGGGG